jgi:hypothetical protein
MPKYLRYALLAFVAFYIIAFRDSSVSILTWTWDQIYSIAHSLGRFLDKLTGDKSNST